jgi:hypothetical protein
MKRISLLLFLACLILPASYSLPLYNECADEKAEQILFEGNLPLPSQKSLIVEAFQVYKNETSLQIHFLSNLGLIDIYIFDEMGAIVYQQSVIASANQQVNISIISLDSGEYTIRLVNSQNQYLEGEFYIE